MASSSRKSAGASRKRRRRTHGAGGPPRAVASTRRAERDERRRAAAAELARGERVLGREGERPPGWFGGVPVSEGAILIGIISAVVGFVSKAQPPLIAGIVLCVLGVVEITAREHFSGYRSHTALLAALPAVAVMAALVAGFGAPRQRLLLLVVVVPIFALLFWLLRRKFLAARQARVARPPTPR